MSGIELYLNNAFWYMLGSIISIIIFKLGSVSEVYKIQVNDSEPIEVSQQIYEVSFCFNEMLKEKDKEIKQSNNIINELEKYLEEELNRLARETSHTYEDSLGKTRLVNENIYEEVQKIKNKLQELKGSDK